MTADDVDVRLGWLVRMRFPRSSVAAASQERKFVRMELDPPYAGRLLWLVPANLTVLHVRLEDAAGFLAALRTRAS